MKTFLNEMPKTADTPATNSTISRTATMAANIAVKVTNIKISLNGAPVQMKE